MYSAKKDGRKRGLHNLHPLCTHPPLEARNAELYEYWCPNARRRGLHIVRDDFFMLRSKSHLSLISSLLLPKSNPLRWASIWFFAG